MALGIPLPSNLLLLNHHHIVPLQLLYLNDTHPSSVHGGMDTEAAPMSRGDQLRRHYGHEKRTSLILEPGRRRRSSNVVWALVILCTLLAVGVIVIGGTVFAVYLLYKPKMPYLLVSDARLVSLEYDGSGTIRNLVVSLTVRAENSNSRADASFSRFDLAVGFRGAEVALLRARPFSVARRSSVPLPYVVVSAGRPLNPDGMRYMDGALKAGVVPLDLFGKARTTWKVGVFVSLRFWTRINCRFLFFYPGNGTAMPIDCRSRSP